MAAGILACVFFKWRALYRLFVNNLEYLKWDYDTVTLNDFTLEFAITEEIWSGFTDWEELLGQPLQARFE